LGLHALAEDKSVLSKSFVTALKETKWPGRCQTVIDPKRKNVTWYLDGAHTVESLECCMQWFVSPGVGLGFGDLRYVYSKNFTLAQLNYYADTTRPTRILIFNCTSGRSGSSFLSSIRATIPEQLWISHPSEGADSFFDHVIFCTNVTYADGKFKGGECPCHITPTAIKNMDRSDNIIDP